jgi:hypothetical protein
MKQPVPVVWNGLRFEERIEAVKQYSFETVKYLRDEGLQNHLYEIGNEIDYGICGEYPGKSSKKNPDSLSARCWPNAAKLILASQAGVRKVDPEARFMLHISHWWDTAFCVRFFTFMQDQGVQIDYAGLSYFPSSNIGGSLEFEEFGAVASAVSEAVQCPIIVPETAYPSTREFKGQFSRWKYEVMGYPITPEGQRRWLREFLSFCNQHPNIHSVYYWSPEWFGEGMWKGFALFDPNGNAKPVWEAFDRKSWQASKPKRMRFFEVHEDQLIPVPLEEARSVTTNLVNQLRQKTGGVNQEHIDLLSTTSLVVESFQVDLRGSSQQNLKLRLSENAKGIQLDLTQRLLAASLRSTVDSIDHDDEKVVLFHRPKTMIPIERVAKPFEEAGIEVIVHPIDQDRPLQFGMSGRFR